MMTLRKALIPLVLTLAFTAPTMAQQERPPRPPPIPMAPSYNPLGHLLDRVGPLWVSTDVETTPDGRRFRDSKSYRRVTGGAAVAVVNARVFDDGRSAVYLEGLYYVDPDGRQLRHVALFSDGALVDEAEHSMLYRENKHFLTFTLTSKNRSTSIWRSGEWIDEDGHLVEQARKWEDEAWVDMGTARYAPHPADTEIATLFE